MFFALFIVIQLYNINQKRIFVKLFSFLRCLLHASNLRVPLQQDVCMYNYSIICLHGNCLYRWHVLLVARYCIRTEN